MALPAGIPTFVADLEAIDKAAYPTVKEAADAFASAFASFLGFGQLQGTPVTPGSNLGPSGVEACAAALIPAFTAPNTPVSSSASMQAAFLAYFNSMPVSSMWSIASAIAPAVPTLGSILTVSMVPGISGPKAKLANGIMQWLTTGAPVTLNVAPWTAFIV